MYWCCNYWGGILAYTNANVDKLNLLNRAVRDDTVEQLQARAIGITIAVGTQHSAAIINDKLYMWGYNDDGQLGLGDTINRKIPTLVTNIPPNYIITQIVLGSYHSAAVINGALYTWGDNANGQLGLGDYGTDRNFPTQVTRTNNGAIPLGTVTKIALGRGHSAAVINGELYTWGYNLYGQLGIGNPNRQNLPTQVTITANGGTIVQGTVTQIALGYYHSAAVINGALYTWGENFNGELGLGTSGLNVNKDIPTHVTTTSDGTTSDSIGIVAQIALGDGYSAAVINGKLHTWGKNNRGQLGIELTSSDYFIPTLVRKLPSGPITQIALGEVHSAAVVDGVLYTWGDNKYGQLGLGKLTPTSNIIPTEVKNMSDGTTTTPIGITTQIKLGGGHSAAVINGSLYTWGRNHYGQLGLGVKEDHLELKPAPISKFQQIQKNTITLEENDLPNIRNKIVYNLTHNDIITIIKAQTIENLNTSFPFYQTNFRYRIGSITGNTGQIIVIYENNSNIFETTINGFKPVNLTQNITITDKVLPVNETSFANDEINQLVADANDDTTGKTNKLSKWIINNSSLFIGNTANEYTSDFPRNARITKVSDVNVVNGSTGTLSFKIDVDKYYKPSAPATNLIESTSTDANITLTKPITLTGFKTTTKSNPSVISSSNRNLSATQLLASFGNTNNVITGNGLTNLKNYIDLSSFPTTATFKIINHSLNVTSLSFQIEATGYYDDKGILVLSTPKEYPKLTIHNLLLSYTQSKFEMKQSQVTLLPEIILQNIGYDSKDDTKPLIKEELEKYVDLISFPSDATYTLIDVNTSISHQPSFISHQLSFIVVANKQYNSIGDIINTNLKSSVLTFEYLTPVLPAESEQPSSDNLGVIIGASVGGAVGLAAIGGATTWFIRKRRKY